jgi:hypothetical protein
MSTRRLMMAAPLQLSHTKKLAPGDVILWRGISVSLAMA